MGQLLWTPSRERVKQTNMATFIEFVNRNTGRNSNPIGSCTNGKFKRFLTSGLQCGNLQESDPLEGYEQVVDDLGKFPGAKWFIRAKLNFAENLLPRDERPAFRFGGERRKEPHVVTLNCMINWHD